MKKPFLCKIWLHKWFRVGSIWFSKRNYYQCARCGSVRIIEDGGKYYNKKDT